MEKLNKGRNRAVVILLAAVLIGLFSSCHKEEVYANTPQSNFEALWKVIDERYCFFEYKDIDWNEVHDRYKARILPGIDNESLFFLFAEMLNELKDGHVNLSSSFNTSRYWKWFQNRPENYNERVIDEFYLNFDFRMTSGIKYKILPNNIGYMYYGSFSSTIGEGALDQIIAHFSSCDGIIIDVRSNGGGNISNVETLASRFTNKRIVSGYIRHKNGPAHNAFSDAYPIYLDPSPRLRFQKSVVVLTNRTSYSATNDFVSVMKNLPTVTLVGDTTGGGSGIPVSSELPNGWSIRFSSSPIYNADREQTEFGIAPTEGYQVDLNPNESLRGIDTMLEKAFTVINTSKNNCFLSKKQ